MRLNRTVVLVMISFVWTCSAWAEDTSLPNGRWWQRPAIVKKIKLTENEIARLDTAFKDNYRKLIDLKSDVAKERFELQMLLEEAQLDDQTVMKQYEKTTTAQNAISRQRFMMLLEVRKIVGYERFKALKAVYERTKNKKAKNQGEKVKLNNS